MKRPLNRNTPIDMKRMSSWMSLFSGYRHAITEGRIERWLDQFEGSDKDIAARILDCVDFITNEQIDNAFLTALSTLPGWDLNKDNRSGRWRFVAYSTSAGESGDNMLHRFRRANGLGRNTNNSQFIHMSQLLSEKLNADDTVVFIDDFSGSGTQICTFWPELQELLPGNPTIFLVLVGASSRAIERIQAETSLTIYCNIRLDDEDNIFSTRCSTFNRTEKQRLLEYCKLADNNIPMGYKDCGLVIVFAHDCPNNSIPILHKHHENWEGLFVRIQ